MSRAVRAGTASALFIMAVGAAFTLYTVFNYDIGTIQYIGPGLFPASVGVLLGAIGIFQLLVGERGERLHLSSINWRAVLCVCSGCAVFAIAINFVGLFLSVALSTFLTAFAQRNIRIIRAGVQSLILGVVAALIFVVGLGVQIEIWPGIG